MSIWHDGSFKKWLASIEIDIGARMAASQKNGAKVGMIDTGSPLQTLTLHSSRPHLGLVKVDLRRSPVPSPPRFPERPQVVERIVMPGD